MINILKAYGVTCNILKAIQSMYKNTKAKVVSPDGESDWIEVKAGVQQGDTLAPYLFVIVLDYALRQAIDGQELGLTIKARRSRRHPRIEITDFDFADDIVLLSDNNEQAQTLLGRVEKECMKVGLKINAKKTNVIKYNIHHEAPLQTSEGKTLSEVNDFKYLGAWVDSTGKDIKIRKALAWRALNGMRTIWRSSMSRDLKCSLFHATIESILLYGCEAWTLTATLNRSLNGCYTRMLRAALNVPWRQHITNDVLYGNIPRVGDRVAARRMELAGHCLRHPEIPANITLLWEPTHGGGRRGRPTTSYVDILRKDTGTMSTAEVASLMKDRKAWGRHARFRLRPPE